MDAAIPLSRKDIVRILAKHCEEAGGQAAFARKAGVAPSQVCDAISGRRDPSPSIITALGFLKVERYVPIKRSAK